MPVVYLPTTPTSIVKRDGRTVPFDRSKIANAIFKAARSIGGTDRAKAEELTDKVVQVLSNEFDGHTNPSVEQIQDIVEKVLVESGHYRTAKSYILYRDLHKRVRDIDSLMDVNKLVDGYLDKADWRVKENANMTFSLQGLNIHVSTAISSKYWLNQIYDYDICQAHDSGDIHLHDLYLLGPYCCGWELKDFLLHGFGGVGGKIESLPPKHFRTALGQVVNFLYTLQGEAAGAQAISNFDTLLAPFVYYDNLSYPAVKQAMQEFMFNMNVPTRVGFQTPFTNVTLDLDVPSYMKDEPAVVGGQLMDKCYREFQDQMDLINRAFAEVMMEGDAKGRVFTFPIPTYNITKDFDWSRQILEPVWEMAAKYGIPYFANYVNSDMSPDDARSMCCRLRLDNRELRRRGGGFFGANPLTGSIGVVTINLPRLGYLATSEDDFISRLEGLLQISRRSLKIKREVLENFAEKGLYPYCRILLSPVKQRFGQYWRNHFSTIGVIGGNETCLNFLGCDITKLRGQNLIVKMLDYTRERLKDFQEEDDQMYNLEATPAEGTSYRLAKLDKERYPNIHVANEASSDGSAPYYTNSTQLPVGFTEDLFDALSLQDDLQTKYTGGTVFHSFLGERLSSGSSAKNLVQKISKNYKLPYFTITPTFSICPSHGYLVGEQYTCPDCHSECEVYSRVTGYLRPVSQWNPGKQAEYHDRKTFNSSGQPPEFLRINSKDDFEYLNGGLVYSQKSFGE